VSARTSCCIRLSVLDDISDLAFESGGRLYENGAATCCDMLDMGDTGALAASI
jgi:hypothetical protein